MSTFCYVIFIFANSNILHINALFAPSQKLLDEMLFFFLLLFVVSVQLKTTCDLTTVADIL